MLQPHKQLRRFAGLTLGLGLLSAALFNSWHEHATPETFIIQGTSLSGVKAAVSSAGGEITHELGVIHAVGAKLTTAQREALSTSNEVQRVYENYRVETALRKADKLSSVTEVIDTSVNSTTKSVIEVSSETGHVSSVMAHQLQAEGITGLGVTLAVLDSGLSFYNQIKRGANDTLRVHSQYDAIVDQELSVWSAG